MRKKTIWAIYADKRQAKDMERDLIRNNFKQADITVAVDRVTGEAMLMLTSFEDFTDFALHMIRDSRPREINC